MKTLIKVCVGTLLFCVALGGVMSFWRGRAAEKTTLFAENMPVKAIALWLKFPTDLIYQSSPDSTVVIGTKKQSSDLFAISAFEQTTAQKLWQLPFDGKIIGQTSRHMLVFEAKTEAVHFIEPRSGKISRRISPVPAHLTSLSSLYTGMAFSDDVYLTTKPLYQQVVVNGKVDDSWKIGITAKTWDTNETSWFLPPVKQIVNIEYAPIIKGDNVLIVNPEQKIGEGHSYQIVALKTGKEHYRGITKGTYYPLCNDRFYERTETVVRRLNPFTQQEIWRLNGAFSFGQLSEIGNQLTILSRHQDGTHNIIRIVDSNSGRLIKQVDIPFIKESTIKGAYFTSDNQFLLHFEAPNFSQPGNLLYDYWVCYDPQTQQPVWRTDFHSESISSLLPFGQLHFTEQ
ncbi:hypothetical protein GCM10028805_31090 [Spirosoma harenae]